MTIVTRRTAVPSLLAAAVMPHATSAHEFVLPDRFLRQQVNTNRWDWARGSIHVVPEAPTIRWALARYTYTMTTVGIPTYVFTERTNRGQSVLPSPTGVQD